MAIDIIATLDSKQKGKEVSWFDKQIEDIAKGSVAKQLAFGGLTGWCSGVLFTKVGKTAASALAGSLLIFQIAQHQGYIKVNWSKLHKDIEKAKHTFNKQTKKQLPGFLQEMIHFSQDNKFIVTGFAGGFLLGYAAF